MDRTEAERNTLGDLFLRYCDEVSPQKKGGALEILRLRKLNADPIAKLKVAALTGKVIAEYRDRRLTGSEKSKSLMALPNKAIDPKEESAMLERHFARQRNWCALAA